MPLCMPAGQATLTGKSQQLVVFRIAFRGYYPLRFSAQVIIHVACLRPLHVNGIEECFLVARHIAPGSD